MSSQHRPRPRPPRRRALTVLTATTATVALVLGAAAAATATDEPTATEPTPTEPTPAEPTEPTPTGPTVVFPEVTAFNPDTYEYAVDVDVPGYTSVWANGLGLRQLEPQGRQVLDLDDGRGAIQVLGCTTEHYSTWDCTEVARSEPLQVRSRLYLSAFETVHTNLTEPTVTVRLARDWWQDHTHTDGDLTWSVRAVDAPEGEPVTGATTYAEASDGTDLLHADLTLPASLAEGTYTLDLLASSDLPDFGRLEQASTTLLVVDTTAPEVWKVKVAEDLFYPQKDTILDHMRLSGRAEKGAEVSVSVLDADGGHVAALDVRRTRDQWTTAWNGRLDEIDQVDQDADGAPAARAGRKGPMAEEGTYSFLIHATDAAGNTTTVPTSSFRLSHGKVRHRWVTLKLKPQDVLLDTSVGRCSRIARKSTHGGRGTLSLQSQTRCRDPRQSHAVALFGAYLPDSYPPSSRGITRRYERPQVSLVGGPAKNGPRSSYAVMGYVDSKDRFKGRRVFRGPWGTHAGVVYKKPYWVQLDKKAGRYYVLWQVGLSEGSRYDLKEFRVRVKAWVMR
jgi:hypothetical protein